MSLCGFAAQTDMDNGTFVIYPVNIKINPPRYVVHGLTRPDLKY
jgi:hypothetical protein